MLWRVWGGGDERTWISLFDLSLRAPAWVLGTCGGVALAELVLSGVKKESRDRNGGEPRGDCRRFADIPAGKYGGWRFLISTGVDGRFKMWSAGAYIYTSSVS